VWTGILCRSTEISGSCNICWSVEFVETFIRRIATVCFVNNMNKYQHCALQSVDLGFILFMRGLDSHVGPPLLRDFKNRRCGGFRMLYRYSSTLSLTFALDGGMWLRPRPGCCTPEKGTRNPLYRRLFGLDECGKSRPPPGFVPRTFQPLASRYTCYAILYTQTHTHTHIYMYILVRNLASNVMQSSSVWWTVEAGIYIRM
jgi:hypothetical protein